MAKSKFFHVLLSFIIFSMRPFPFIRLFWSRSGYQKPYLLNVIVGYFEWTRLNWVHINIFLIHLHIKVKSSFPTTVDAISCLEMRCAYEVTADRSGWEVIVGFSHTLTLERFLGDFAPLSFWQNSIDLLQKQFFLKMQKNDTLT